MDGDSVWVYLETNKGTPSVSTYRGKIDRTTFDALMTAGSGLKWVHLRSVYWSEEVWDHVKEEHVPRYTRYGRDGRWRHCNGDMFLRAEYIVSLSPLSSAEYTELKKLEARDEPDSSLR